MAYSKVKRNDIEDSKKVTKLLQKYFYPFETTEYVDLENLNSQYRGFDCIFTFNGKRYACDEKSNAKYRTRRLTTFVLELSFENESDGVQEGWFIDGKHSNDAFIFVWIYKNEMDVALVERSAIEKHLEGIGWTKDKLRLKAWYIRSNPKAENMGDLYKNGCRFCFSEKLPEKPVNVLLSKRTYEDLALITRRYSLTEEDLALLDG